MATEYIVIADQESVGLQKGGLAKWNNAAAESEILQIKAARYIVVNAETQAEAVRGVKQNYPGWIKTKVIVVEKAATEEV